MSIENAGKTLTLEPNRIYLMISDENDGVAFNVVDTLDHEKDDERAKFLSCMVRGLIQIALDDPISVVDTGVNSFIKDNAEVPIPSVNGAPILPSVSDVIKDVPGDEGVVVQFPWKTIGNA